MPRIRHAPILLLVAVATAGAAGCGTSDDSEIVGGTLTIYMSLPLEGERGEASEDMVNAAKLALADAGGTAGDFDVNAVFLDDSTGRPARWDPGRVGLNARRAAQDSRAAAYIGEFESGASRISLPITNQAGIAYVSPASTAVGLTRVAEGTDIGEPERYYPTGDRTLVRIVPADDVQARAGARWARLLGAKRVAALHDGTDFGKVVADAFAEQAEAEGLDLAGPRRVGGGRHGGGDAAARLAREGADLVYYAGARRPAARGLLNGLARRLPEARLMGTDAIAGSGFVGRLTPAARNRLRLTLPTQDPSALPRRGRAMLREYRKRFGGAPSSYTAYGYEAMALVLDAIERGGKEAGDRDRIVESLFLTSNRRSVLGTYSVAPSGDTTLRRMSGARVKGGRVVFERTLTAPRR